MRTEFDIGGIEEDDGTWTPFFCLTQRDPVTGEPTQVTFVSDQSFKTEAGAQECMQLVINCITRGVKRAGGREVDTVSPFWSKLDVN